MHRNWTHWLLAVAVVFSIARVADSQSAAPAAPGQIILHQTPLGPMPADSLDMSIASDGGRIAISGNSGTRLRVFIDGNQSPPYSSIVQMPAVDRRGQAPRRLMISADHSTVAYVAGKGPGDFVMVVNQKEGPDFDRINSAFFSPVGHRLAYVASKGTQQILVADGTAGTAYAAISEVTFSADGKHLAYIVRGTENPPKTHVVLDGKDGAPYTNTSRLVISRTGRIAYVANTGGLYDNYMVIDGQAGPKYAILQQPVIFSDDGGHYAYNATKGIRNPIKHVVVIDGTEGPEYDVCSSVVFSPDGKHWAYWAQDVTGARNVTYAIVDGKKSLDYLSVTGFAFSPDSQHVVYVATASNQKTVVVLDGNEGDAHDSIVLQPQPFSPDSKRLAYVAIDQQRQRLVVDDKVGPAYGAVDGRSVQFSPDCQHYIYKTAGGALNGAYAMDDVQSTDLRDAMVMSPDWKHSAATIVKDAGTGVQTEQVVLDGKPIGQTYRVVTQLQISPDGNHVAFVGTSADATNRNIHVVYDGHEGPAYFRIDKLLLSPDGQHYAYACTEDGSKHYVVIDSFQGPVFDDIYGGITQDFEAMQFHADGSLSFIAAKDKKASRNVYGPDAFAALPKPSAAGSSAAAATPGYAQIYAFGSVDKDGTSPLTLTAGPDGTIYGGTTSGGQYQQGVIFKCSADGSGYTILHQIIGGSNDGARPNSMRVGPDGALYGTLQVQGKSGNGAVYRISPDGSDFKILRGFDGSDGQVPTIAAIDPDGTIYAITLGGAIFRMKPDGSDFTKAYDLRANGNKSIGLFADGGDGYFYGGGTGRTFVRVKKDGTDYSVIKTFDGPPLDAANTDRAPILGSDNFLYGLSANGGQRAGGVIFKVGRDGSGYKVLLNPDSDQLNPSALVEGPDGKLYALVHAGIVSFNKDGSEYAVVKAMDGNGFPRTAAVHGGALFGAYTSGGKGGGIIFRFGFGGGGSGSGGGGAAGPSVVIQNVPPTPLAAPE
jgi:uncharacterized repeat protein (TIGR03803 family)